MSTVLNMVWEAFRSFIFDLAVVTGNISVKRTSRKLECHMRLLIILIVISAIMLKVRLIVVPCCEYFIFSVMKHIGIAFAADGNWHHTLSGGNYLIGKYAKENLISSNSMAQFLNSCASTFVGKVIQVTLLIGCMAIAITIIALIFRCIIGIVAIIAKKSNNRNYKEVSYTYRRR